MAEAENFTSHLPKPSARFGHVSPSKPLGEISSSVRNARDGTMLPPPPTTGHKRQASNFAEPASKRKTLIERAGETNKPSLAAPRSITPVTSAVLQAAQQRNHSANSSFSQSYRSNSISSRTASNSSFSSSVGSGIRPPSAQSYSGFGRPKSSLAKDRITKPADSTPATSLGTHGGIQEGSDSNRMLPFLSYSIASAAYPRPTRKSVSKPLDETRKNPSTREYSRLPIEDDQFARFHDTSIISQMQALKFNSSNSESESNKAKTPTRIPQSTHTTPMLPSTPPARKYWSPPPFPKSRSPIKKEEMFLTKTSATTGSWNPEEQYSNMERMYETVVKHYKVVVEDSADVKEANNWYKSTITNLEQERSNLSESIITLRSDLESTRYCLNTAERAKEALKHEHAEQIGNLKQEHEEYISNLRHEQRLEAESVRQAQRDEIDHIKDDHRDEIKRIKRKFDEELEEERTQRMQALSQASVQGALEKQKQQMDIDVREQEIRNIRAEFQRTIADLERERTLSDDLRKDISSAGSFASSMEAARQALQAKIDYLESDNKSQSEAYAAMEQRMNEALQKAQICEEKLRKEETLRRKLHNQVQELKGNIRVFCRVRPINHNDELQETAKISFPDEEDQKEIEVKGPEEVSSLGKITTKSYPFAFDRVFDPKANNMEIFEDISQLIQSALDGFNVCIFAYGQTGSGKTYTMSSHDGMIPLALRQIYSTSKDLESRGWTYSMEGSFVEVYNEEIRDLLGKDGDIERTNKKHEIRHDMVKCETTITDVTTLNLDSQDQVEAILAQAMSKRSVAATNANERSSRSHSVFILKLVGHNSITGENSKGTLNLVDLAGSERLSQSKVEGARLKETQNINKSLSCLGDVIGALGQQQQRESSGFNPRESVNGNSSNGTSNGAHIPYRNSKLTYLLQFSLGGNSKTLMFVMVAPEKKCLSETITSLKFADKVSKTRIGVAKKLASK